MGCTFCHTGQMGLVRQLSTAQIIEQLVEVRRMLAEEGSSTSATNIVFMGMGASCRHMCSTKKSDTQVCNKRYNVFGCSV
jgi:adenine C2-methylase RlmN of 23S rRNA A2503 and tRNA A37